MTEDTTFTCKDCGRKLPPWMEGPRRGICEACSDAFGNGDEQDRRAEPAADDGTARKSGEGAVEPPEDGTRATSRGRDAAEDARSGTLADGASGPAANEDADATVAETVETVVDESAEAVGDDAEETVVVEDVEATIAEDATVDEDGDVVVDDDGEVVVDDAEGAREDEDGEVVVNDDGEVVVDEGAAATEGADATADGDATADEEKGLVVHEGADPPAYEDAGAAADEDAELVVHEGADPPAYEEAGPPASEEADPPADESSQAADEVDDDASRWHAVEPFWDPDVDVGGLETDAPGAAEPFLGDEDRPRADSLDEKIDNWKEQLLDLTRRNHLVDFAPTKTKSLPLYRADPEAVAGTLLARDPLYVRRSAGEDDGGAPADPETLGPDEVAATRSESETESTLYRVRLNQKRSQEEKGVNSLFVAFGTLRWYADDPDDELRSPLFLVAVDLDDEPNRDADRHDYEITTEDATLQVNPALRKKLSAEHNRSLPPDEAFDLADLETAFAYVDDLASGVEEWEVVPEVVLGIFDFAKYSLYADLEQNREAVRDDPFVRAMNGDPDALPTPPETPAASELDEAVSSADVFQVLDADASQQEAIEAAKRGMSFVLQGPPGTGKSQTIANIVAEKLAADETVLFVSEKQAALDVVKDRLDDVGLGRFCLEVHGEKASKKRVLESLESELKSEPLRRPDDRDDVVRSLDGTRRRLNDYSDHLFYRPEGQDVTPYEAFGVVANRDDEPRVDLGIADPLGLDQAEIDGVVDDLAELAAYEHQIDAFQSAPWRHTTLRSWRVDADETVEAALEAATTAFVDVLEAKTRVESRLGISIDTVAEFRGVARLVALVAERPDVQLRERYFDRQFYATGDRLRRFARTDRRLGDARATIEANYDQSMYAEDPADLHARLNGYGRLRYVKPSYHRLKSQMLSHARDGYDPGHGDLVEDARALMEIERLESEREEFRDLEAKLGPLYEGPETDWETVFELRDWVAAFEAVDAVDSDPLRAMVVESSPGGRDSPGAGLVDPDIDLEVPGVESAGPGDGSERAPATDADVEALAAACEDAESDWDAARDELEAVLDLGAVRLSGHPIEEAPFERVKRYLDGLESNRGELHDWAQFHRRREAIEEGPAGDFLAAYLAAGHPADSLVPAFELSFYTEWLNAVYEETALDSFSETEYRTLLSEFRRLDRQQREHAKAEIQHRVTNRRPEFELQHASSSEQVFLKREIQKRQRHEPLRTLFDRASSLITDLKPCFMMSPLSVGQYLQYDSVEFDTVIFDEASQIMPQDAVSSIIRGDQLVVAGDSKQLPPTSFFEADVGTAAGVREDLESILDETASLLQSKRLRWHYRSDTDELIAFSNGKYYDGDLETFPGNHDAPEMGVDFEYVEDGVYDRGGTRRNEPEAERVVDLVEDHVAETPDRSLGVVAFSQAQAQAVRDEIEERRMSDPDLDAFVSEDDALEGFFVKSLENVQGDERDALLFSVGYGPDESGGMWMNFGPLNRKGGERRLNVAVTRAKKHIQVVSSIQPEDVDLSETASRGVEDFKHYLEYAKYGDRALARDGDEAATGQFDSEFEAAVHSALVERGFDVVAQVPGSGYSVDLAIEHPDEPGQYVLGIECDGAAYRSTETARERDRTRQAVLEDLGWAIHRIWSPDWAANSEAELREIAERVESLVDDSTRADGGVDAAPVEPVAVDAIPEDERGGVRDHITDYEEPALAAGPDRDFDDIPTEELLGTLVGLVEEYGPVKQDVAYRALVERWHVTRLSKTIRQTLEGWTLKLHQRGELRMQDGFLWPAERPSSVDVREHTDSASREIGEVPMEELAKAAFLVLDVGREMTREDLVLETARLYGYARLGSNIERRIDDAVDLLVDVGGAEAADGTLEPVGDGVDEALLARVYD